MTGPLGLPRAAFAPSVETVVKSRLHAYAAAVLDRLPEGARPGRVVPVSPGRLPAFDDCCSGLLYGRVDHLAPVAPPKVGAAAGVRCGALLLQATVALGLVRCAATVTKGGAAPRAEAVLADGHEMLDDMLAIERAVLASPHTRSLVGWTPLEAEGGCHGGEWVFTMQVPLAPDDCA